VHRYETVFFDIDGTLCDPGTGITDAVRYALGRMGIDEQDAASLRRFVGPPLEHSFRDYYGLGSTAVEEAVGHYREHYTSEGIARYRAYPGAEDVLTLLAEEGVRTAVVTAKVQWFAEEALRVTGLDALVPAVFGRALEDVVTKTVTLTGALRVTGAAAGSSVMVGDREHDVRAANDTGLDSIGVLHGYGTPEELHHAGATHVVGSLEEVAPLVLGP
jgi:phosphoglycolate phosphatase